MNIQVSDYILRRTQISAIDLYVALAVQLYADNRIDYGDACRLAGIAEAAFNRELLSRKISVQQYHSRRTAS